MRITSISLGSPEGDYEFSIATERYTFMVQRIGTNGSVQKFKELLRYYDGKSDVISFGGINFSYILGSRQYPLPLAQELKAVVQESPVVDGSLYKAWIEPYMVDQLFRTGIIRAGQRVLLASVLDRFHLGKALEDKGLMVEVGDPFFALGLPVTFSNLESFELVARLTLPVLRHIPLSFLYPLGEKQLDSFQKYPHIYHRNNFVAGDYHFIRKYLPKRLKGQGFLVSTIRESGVEELVDRGARVIISLAPKVEGVTLGANLWDGIFFLLARKLNLRDMPEDWVKIAEMNDWRSDVLYSNLEGWEK